MNTYKHYFIIYFLSMNNKLTKNYQTKIKTKHKYSAINHTMHQKTHYFTFLQVTTLQALLI